jgi:hypothetical protein
MKISSEALRMEILPRRTLFNVRVREASVKASGMLSSPAEPGDWLGCTFVLDRRTAEAGKQLVKLAKPLGEITMSLEL